MDERHRNAERFVHRAQLSEIGQLARPGDVAHRGEERVLHQRTQQDVGAELLGVLARARGQGSRVSTRSPTCSPWPVARIGTRASPSQNSAAESGCGVTCA